MEFLAPWFERLHDRFHQAMRLYNEQYPDSVRAEHDDSVAAHCVHGHLVAGFMREFEAERGFNFLKLRGLQVVNIFDRVVARMKKVSAEGRHQNADTEQQRCFDRQEDIPGLPPAALRLTFGYEPDPAFSTCERVIVACPNGKAIRWAAQIVEDGGLYVWNDITVPRLKLG
jgi:hypothetical protein